MHGLVSYIAMPCIWHVLYIRKPGAIHVYVMHYTMNAVYSTCITGSKPAPRGHIGRTPSARPTAVAGGLPGQEHGESQSPGQAQAGRPGRGPSQPSNALRPRLILPYMVLIRSFRLLTRTLSGSIFEASHSSRSMYLWTAQSSRKRPTMLRCPLTHSLSTDRLHLTCGI